jgi:ABC-type uncharacterized transport system auxiliary subunit
MKIIKLFALLMSSLWLLSACGIGATMVPADHFYRLPAPQAQPVEARKFDHILVRPVRVEGLYHERAILYVEQARPLEIQRYHYYHWVEPPASLVAKHLQGWLQQSALADRVSFSPSVATAQLEISALINEFHRLVTDQGIDNQLAIEFTLRYANEPGKTWSKQYRVSQPSASAAMHDSARAFGEALDRIMAMLLKDLLEIDR